MPAFVTKYHTDITLSPQRLDSMGRESTPDPITLVYKSISVSGSVSPEGSQSDIALHLDVYPPDSHSDNASLGGDDIGVPAVVYFHGGGLVVGDRKSWFPKWLHGQRRLPSNRYICSPGLIVTIAHRTSI